MVFFTCLLVNMLEAKSLCRYVGLCMQVTSACECVSIGVCVDCLLRCVLQAL